MKLQTIYTTIKKDDRTKTILSLNISWWWNILLSKIKEKYKIRLQNYENLLGKFLPSSNKSNLYLRMIFIIVISNMKQLKLNQYIKYTIVIKTLYYCSCMF